MKYLSAPILSLLTILALLCGTYCQEDSCPSPTVHYREVVEGEPSGTEIFNARTLFPNFNFVVVVNVSRHELYGDYFTAPTRGHSSSIRTVKTIDREEIARDLSGTVAPVIFKVTIANVDLSNLQSHGCVEVILRVVDINEFSPQFPNSMEEATFTEDDMETDNFFPLPLALDKDEGENSTTSYSLEDDLGVFYLDVRRSEHTQAIQSLQLKNMVPLDREEQDSYDLRVIASEGREGGSTATLNVHVVVIDRCDKSPMFEMSHYSSVISENSTVGLTILNVTALDEDTGNAGRLTYNIESVDMKQDQQDVLQPLPPTETQPFILDMETGLLILNGTLDRERFSEYRITVNAVDGCMRSASATVNITVSDVNDNCPFVRYDGLHAVEENHNPDESFIGFITVSDEDSGMNAVVTVELFDNTTGPLLSSDYFVIEGISLRLSRELDREIMDHYSLIIRAQDHGTPPLTCQYHLPITILDYNDNDPVLDPLPEPPSVRENSAANMEVTTFHATDRDINGNPEIFYELPPSNDTFPYQDLFSIEEETGCLKVQGLLDREQHSVVSILVVAKDNPVSGPTRSASVVVNITINDTNDNSPVIVYPAQGQELSISEDATPGSHQLAQVMVTDDDTEDLTRLTFSLSNNVPFRIDSQDGIITLDSSLDFESTESHQLNITVHDGNTQHTTYRVVTVRVQGVNEPPAFDRMGEYLGSVLENQPPDTSVTRIGATDPEGADLTFSIVGGNERNQFYIDSPSGVIYTRVVLDREEDPGLATANYTLFVTVKDDENLFAATTAPVRITVLDEHDHSPQFTQSLYNFEMRENIPGGGSVGEVEAVSLDQDGAVIYEIISTTVAGLFEINGNSGLITTTQVLDREAIDSDISLIVKASTTGIPPLLNETRVTVKILDVNDNPPIFVDDGTIDYTPIGDKRWSVSVSVRENDIGLPFFTVKATDRDITPHNVTLYSLSDDNDASITGRFHIDERLGVLTLIGSLDYDTEMSLEVIVLATDEDRADFQATLVVNVEVIDVRPDDLVFPENFSFGYSVLENVAADYPIVTFEVTDLDGNSVGRLQYNLTNYPDGSESQEFGIVEHSNLSATIYTRTANLDRDTPDSDTFVLNVSVNDPILSQPGDLVGFASRIITIEVRDVNDNPPVFQELSYTFEVHENRGRNEFVGVVTAVDIDEGSNSQVSYSMSGSSAPFNISSSGRISTLSVLNREEFEQYEFTVVATDAGTQPQSGLVTVVVNVIDVNDNPPHFVPDLERITITVSENAELGDVATLRASDADSGSNGEVTFDVAPGSALDDHFVLESSGKIRLVRPLDRELDDVYIFRARVRDGGSPPQEDTAEFEIDILDYNDHPPVFINPPSIPIIIPENHPYGTPFVFLETFDDDEGTNAEVMYSLADNSLCKIFSVHGTTGTIQLAQPDPEDYTGSEPYYGDTLPPAIDYERESEYEVEIIAYDNGNPRRFASTTLTVMITNINEHAPQFDRNVLTAYVEEGQPPGTLVLPVTAYDWDYDTIQYSLARQEPESHFRWDPTQGAIVTNWQLDYNSIGFYILDLRASELIGTFNSTISVEVFVINVNDHDPMWETTEVSATVSENADVGTLVATVRATDLDNATNDAVTYSIVRGNGGVFTIDPQTGNISISASLDYESQSEYTLVITATDTGFPQRTSQELEATISLVNENDEHPEFTDAEYTFTIGENVGSGVVGQVMAPDRDEGSFGVVRYSISDGASEHFSINEETGEILLEASVDREALESDTITFTVTASDSGDPAKTDTASVVVIIEDQNDNSPQFSQQQYLVYIEATQPVGQTFTILTATDEDVGSNAAVNFELVDPSAGVSLAVSSTGELSLEQPVPDNFQQFYDFTVRAVDSQDGSRHDEASIRLFIQTATDHHPQFDMQTYEVSLSESSNPGTLVFNISEKVTDPDSGPSGQLSYAVFPDLPQFSLDTESGLIRIADPLDFEEVQSYELMLYAMDTTPGGARTATASLQVRVCDENDEAPHFTDPPSTITLSPVPYPNVRLFTVTAVDRDSGDEGRIGYSIVGPALFCIDSQGVVTNKDPLEDSNSYSFVIRAFDHGHPLMSSNITVLIQIQSPGSNIPVFADGTELMLNVPESLSAGTTIRTFATDSSSDTFHIAYRNSSDMFTVGETDGELVLQAQLDHEEATQYRLVVEARRAVSAESHHSSYLQVDILVGDENDESPHFTPIGPQDVMENAEIGEEVFTVSATDADGGSLGEVRYDIIGGNVGRVFSVDSLSGVVTVAGSLDRETIDSYELLIRASDQDPIDPKREEITVLVRVGDKNDEVPFFSSNYSISVYESPHTLTGDWLIQITATDHDSGPPLQYDIDLISWHANAQVPDPLEPFGIGSDTGIVTVRTELNHEEIDFYLLEVRATDTERTVTTHLHVTVLDVNEHPPMLSVPRAIRVLELMPVGALVTDEVVATDADFGPNGGIRYSLGAGWPEGKFQIDSASGVIRIAERITFDPDTETHEGEVIAVDLGVPQHRVVQNVTINIMDVNDHAPQFTQESYDLCIPFNTQRGATIFQFEATDDDYQSNGGLPLIQFPIYYPERDIFYIAPDGYMSLLRDSEQGLEMTNYTFKIAVCNTRPFPFGPQYVLSSYVDVTVRVRPENTDTPVFTRGMYTANISVNFDDTMTVPLGMSASDGNNDRIEFSIQPPNETPFTIDETSGAVRLGQGQSLIRQESDSYELTILAVDNGCPAQTGTAEVHILVLDINLNAPVFASDQFEGSVLENSDIGTVVLTVSATDPGTEGEVTYQLDSSIEGLPFEIDASSGVIVTSAELDYEQLPSRYSFLVIASDDGQPPRQSTATVTVTLLGLNEFLPVFTMSSYEFTVESSARAGSVVGSVNATDGDRGGMLTYRFTNEAPSRYFRIVDTTGEIVLTVNSSLGDGADVQSVGSRSKRAPNSDNFFIVVADVEVSDNDDPPSHASVEVELYLHNSFNPDLVTTTEAPSSPDLIIIYIVAALGAALAIVAFVAFMVTTLICKMKRSRKLKINDAHQMRNNDYEMTHSRFSSGRYSSRSGSTTPSSHNQVRHTIPYPEHTTLNHSLSGSDSSRRSYTADDEMESINGEGAPVVYSHSPSLPGKPSIHSSPRARSTSDLASSVGTEVLTPSQETGPYTKQQLDQIYAANIELLTRHGSQDSVHTFDSEGGMEADGDDIDNILMTKYTFDDDDDSTTNGEDEVSFMGKDPMITDSSGNLDIPPVEEREDPYVYSQGMKGPWIPTASSMADTVNELASYADDPLSARRYGAGYEHSQGTSIYAASQGSQVPLLRKQQKIYGSDKQLQHMPRDYPPLGYYPDMPESRHPRNHHMPHSQRYASSTGLGEHPLEYPHHHLPQHLHYSQDLPVYHRNHPHFVPSRRTPPSSTPTDGTVTPQTALAQDYDPMQAYLSSSSTSLASTNLSQPIRTPRMYHH